MKLTVIYDCGDETQKWLIRKENIGDKLLQGIVVFGDNRNFSAKDIWWIRNLSIKRDFTIPEEKWLNSSTKLKSDRFRKLNIQEYFKLSENLKLFKTTYNKKKDEFINVPTYQNLLK